MRTTAFGENQESRIDHLIAELRYGRVEKEILPNTTVLDLGCGYEGLFLSAVAARIRRGVGIDLSVSRAVNRGGIELFAGNVEDPLPFTNNSFDVVTCMALIEHVLRPESLLREARRVLKPGGKIVLTTPSLYGKLPLEMMANLNLISREEIRDHKRYYTVETLAEELRRTGFEPRHIKVGGFSLFKLNLFAKAIK